MKSYSRLFQVIPAKAGTQCPIDKEGRNRRAVPPYLVERLAQLHNLNNLVSFIQIN